MGSVLGPVSIGAACASALASAVLYAVPGGSRLEVPMLLAAPALAFAAVVLGGAGAKSYEPDGRARIVPSAVVGVLLGLAGLAVILYELRGLGR